MPFLGSVAVFAPNGDFGYQGERKGFVIWKLNGTFAGFVVFEFLGKKGSGFSARV